MSDTNNKLALSEDKLNAITGGRGFGGGENLSKISDSVFVAGKTNPPKENDKTKKKSRYRFWLH